MGGSTFHILNKERSYRLVTFLKTNLPQGSCTLLGCFNFSFWNQMGKIRIYIEKCNKEKKIWYFYFVATFNVWFVKYCWYQLPTCRRNSSKKKEKMTQYFDLQWWCSEETGLHKLTGCCARRIALNRPLTAQPCWKGRLEEVNLPRKFNNNWRHSDAQTIRQESFQKEVCKVRGHFFSAVK